jgi:hypothetical protein
VACLADGLHSAHHANSFDSSGAGTSTNAVTSASAPTASRQRGRDAARHAAREPSQDGHEGKGRLSDGYKAVHLHRLDVVSDPVL